MDDAPTSQPEPPRSLNRPPGLGVDVVDATGRLGADRLAWLIDRARQALAPLEAAGEVRVRVVDDAEMAAAHARWAGVEGTTDVLTFDLRDDPAGPLDADVLACLDEAERQAAAHGHAPERELLLYVVHAALHCCGHDDHDEADAARMHALEDDLLERAGVGATFDPSRPRAGSGRGQA